MPTSREPGSVMPACARCSRSCRESFSAWSNGNASPQTRARPCASPRNAETESSDRWLPSRSSGYAGTCSPAGACVTPCSSRSWRTRDSARAKPSPSAGGTFRERTILIERALALGRLKTTKTGKTRTVRLLAPLAADLNEWRLAQGRPDGSAPVFPNRDGSTWSDVTWRNWRRRVFAPAAATAGLGVNTRPYDLRHSFVSLLLLEGATVVEVARQAGHSPTMTLSTYAHLFEELEGTETRSAEDEIRRAREAARGSRTRFVPATGSKATGPLGRTPANPEKPTPGLEPGTPSLRVSRRCHQQSPAVTSGHSPRRSRRTARDSR
jgi:hypothetical protein